jgi:hypothetical protein
MSALRAARKGCKDGATDKVGKFFAGNWEIGFRCNGRAEVDFDFPQAADRMKSPSFCGNELHVFEEDRNHREARFLGDVIEARLTRADAYTIAACAFGKHDEVKIACGTAKFLEFANPAGIEFTAFEKEADAAAENAFEPRGVPDGFVAENENRIAS